MLFKDVQDSNAAQPIVVILSGKLISSNALQYPNTPPSIFVRFSDNFTRFNAVQYSNAS